MDLSAQFHPWLLTHITKGYGGGLVSGVNRSRNLHLYPKKSTTKNVSSNFQLVVNPGGWISSSKDVNFNPTRRFMLLKDVKKILNHHKKDLFDYGVYSLAIFGSTARGEVQPKAT